MAKELYRIGVTPDCPVHQVSLGGQNFTRRSEVVTGYGSDTKRREIQGSIVRLDAADLDKIRQSAARKVVRSTSGARSVAKVHSKDSRVYIAREGDREMSNFVYVQRETVDPTQTHSYSPLSAEGPAPKARRPRQG